MGITKYSTGEVLGDDERKLVTAGADEKARAERLAAADAEDRAADTPDR